ncbi:galactosamine 6-phosphate isomerase AgaS [Ignavigranum ruoffiae]|uniref:Galactosamine 6-phosphate isomerase AgaS n=1 Tax=Ignavigranum ruoffiae TaxID=89093 RepID=A0A1H9EZ84_9LACT|nr:SIS domain-containing protein [Ignavigranum ruoffiae]SEQ31040.1 galactosamine 6-phosphate isomerase AgaS [Ignavigranum ruoffiae]
MFEASQEYLASIGATITTKEIKQQPQLWQEAYQLYRQQEDKINRFLEDIFAKHDFVRVIFSGAGTSEFVGQTISPYLNKIHDGHHIQFESVATTHIVAAPEYYLQKDMPTILVSFARSGNSPESLKTVELAKELVDDLYQITITCAPEGKLAQASQGDESNLLLLQPAGSNDQGFAMTGSYTCMSLTALLVFDQTIDKEEMIGAIVKMGQNVLGQEERIQALADLGFKRIIYLGANGFFGLARESQLKISELTAGKIATMYDSPLGFRHGPKSFIDEDSLVVVYVSNNDYTRLYDQDLINEVYHDQIAKKVFTLNVGELTEVQADQFVFDNQYRSLADVYLSFPFILFAQSLALLTSIKIGNKPDTPSPSGTVNRVVQGVILHEYK